MKLNGGVDVSLSYCRSREQFYSLRYKFFHCHFRRSFCSTSYGVQEWVDRILDWITCCCLWEKSRLILLKVKSVLQLKHYSTYNPGRKVLGHPPFSTCFYMEFAANLQYTLINTALTRFLPSPLLLEQSRGPVKVVWLVTPNTVQGERGINMKYILLI